MSASSPTARTSIVLVDEAHRTQEGLYGIRMRGGAAEGQAVRLHRHADRDRRPLDPEGVLAGDRRRRTRTTSTPTRRSRRSRTGPRSRLRYEPRLVELAHFEGEELDRSFAAVTEDLTDEEREKREGRTRPGSR